MRSAKLARMRWLAAIALALVFPSCSSDPPRAIDAAIDGPNDGVAELCRACGAGQLCVARYDGTCLRNVVCVARTVDCPSDNSVCSAACETAYCPSPYQCHYRPGCGGQPPPPGIFTCYGP